MPCAQCQRDVLLLNYCNETWVSRVAAGWRGRPYALWPHEVLVYVALSLTKLFFAIRFVLKYGAFEELSLLKIHRYLYTAHRNSHEQATRRFHFVPGRPLRGFLFPFSAVLPRFGLGGSLLLLVI